MKINVFFIMLIFSVVVFGQNNLPKNMTDVSPLLIGEKIPDISITGMDKSSISLRQITKNKKTILVFYRGGWCPYCNLHLSALGEAEETLIALGYQIIAISPDSPESLKETVTKDKINYQLFSDSQGKLSKEFGIAYAASLINKPFISKGSESVNKEFLPVPSLFIVDQDNEIIFEYISTNIKNRISNELLIAVITALNK